MNVLSVFDGMSCGQIALNKIGIRYENYIASEIDRYCINVTQSNFPNTIQAGDVRFVQVTKHGVQVFYFVKHQIKSILSWEGFGKRFPENPQWVKTLGPVPDIIFAGSPCQGFSRAGKGLNFEDPRSKLFFEFVRILNQARMCNPKVKFFLENVDMLEEWENIITKLVGIQPIKINSSLVSAQNRVRLYWTNIGTIKDMFGNEVPAIPQPKDLGLTLKDILQHEVDEKYYISDADCKDGTKTTDLKLTYFKGHDNHGARTVIQVNESKESGGIQPYQQNRVYSENGLMPSLSAELSGRNNIETKSRIRRLTPIECERLQAVPDDYTSIVSDSQRYKMLGNGWQVDTIIHILKYLR